MKIVINIPEKYLNSNIIDVTLFTGVNNTITDVNVEDKYTEFQVLPKGHGDLIDRDALIQKHFIPNVGWELVDLDDLKTTPTVIKADT